MQLLIIHKTVNTSKPENELNEFLINLFGADDIMRNYQDKQRYPFHCDFYIRSLDLFIELNLFWTHGKHPFNPKSEEDLSRLKYLNEKAKTSTFYKAGIDVWTLRDPLKLQIAKNNNLDYIMIYNECEIPNLKELIKEKLNASKRL